MGTTIAWLGAAALLSACSSGDTPSENAGPDVNNPADAGVTPEGSAGDSGTPEVDGGTPEVDGGTPVVDGGTDAATDGGGASNPGGGATGGVKIAYGERTGLWIADTSAGTKTLVLPAQLLGPVRISVSPDGTRILTEDEFNAATGSILDWSGTRVATIAARPLDWLGDDRIVVRDAPSQYVPGSLKVFKSDGTAERTLATNMTTFPTLVGRAPDGKHIALAVGKTLNVYSGDGMSDATKAANPRAKSVGPTSFTPDGRLVQLQGFGVSGSPDRIEVHVMDVALTSDRIAIMSAPAAWVSIQPGRTGGEILARTETQGADRYRIPTYQFVNVDTGVVTDATDWTASKSVDVKISPSRAMSAYVGDKSTGFSLFLARPDGTGATKLALAVGTTAGFANGVTGFDW